VDHVSVGTDQQPKPGLVQEYDTFTRLVDAMLRGGFTSTDTSKIVGGNYPCGTSRRTSATTSVAASWPHGSTAEPRNQRPTRECVQRADLLGEKHRMIEGDEQDHTDGMHRAPDECDRRQTRRGLLELLRLLPFVLGGRAGRMESSLWMGLLPSAGASVEIEEYVEGGV
jgi:hypothetical protein